MIRLPHIQSLRPAGGKKCILPPACFYHNVSRVYFLEATVEIATDRTEKLVDALTSRGLCVPKEPKITSSWISRIETRALARWSCNVVVDMVKSSCDALRPHLGDIPAKFVMHVFKPV